MAETQRTLHTLGHHGRDCVPPCATMCRRVPPCMAQSHRGHTKVHVPVPGPPWLCQGRDRSTGAGPGAAAGTCPGECRGAEVVVPVLAGLTRVRGNPSGRALPAALLTAGHGDQETALPAVPSTAPLPAQPSAPVPSRALDMGLGHDTAQHCTASPAPCPALCLCFPAHGAPCHARPCCAVPCRARPRCAIRVILCQATLCRATREVPCRAIPCQAMPRCAVPCHKTLCHPVPYMPCRAMPCDATHAVPHTPCRMMPGRTTHATPCRDGATTPCPAPRAVPMCPFGVPFGGNTGCPPPNTPFPPPDPSRSAAAPRGLNAGPEPANGERRRGGQWGAGRAPRAANERRWGGACGQWAVPLPSDDPPRPARSRRCPATPPRGHAPMPHLPRATPPRRPRPGHAPRSPHVGAAR